MLKFRMVGLTVCSFWAALMVGLPTYGKAEEVKKIVDIPPLMAPFLTPETIITRFNQANPQVTPPLPKTATLKWTEITIEDFPLDLTPLPRENQYSFIHAFLDVSADGKKIKTIHIDAAFAISKTKSHSALLALEAQPDDMPRDEVKRFDVRALGDNIGGHPLIALDNHKALATDNIEEGENEWVETSFHAVDLNFKEVYRFNTHVLNRSHEFFPESDSYYVSDLQYLDRKISTTKAPPPGIVIPIDQLLVQEINQKGICDKKISRRNYFLVWDSKINVFKEVVGKK